MVSTQVSCMVHQMISWTASSVKPVQAKMVLTPNTASDMNAYVLSVRNTWLCFLPITFHCQRAQSRRTGGKIRFTKSFGIRMIRNTITMKPTSINGE